MELPSPTDLASVLRDTNVGLVVLFGSQARGTARPNSDVDLGVLDVSWRSLAWRDYRKVWGILSKLMGRDVDLADLGTPDAIFRYEVVSSGRPLYERRPGLWPEFVAKALIDHADLAPFIPRFIEGVRRAAARDAGP